MNSGHMQSLTYNNSDTPKSQHSYQHTRTDQHRNSHNTTRLLVTSNHTQHTNQAQQQTKQYHATIASNNQQVKQSTSNNTLHKRHAINKSASRAERTGAERCQGRGDEDSQSVVGSLSPPFAVRRMHWPPAPLRPPLALPAAAPAAASSQSVAEKERQHDQSRLVRLCYPYSDQSSPTRRRPCQT